jgi:hypothetical protein
MQKHALLTVSYALCLFLNPLIWGESVTQPSGNLTVSLDPDGTYQVSSKGTGWQLQGKLPNQATNIVSGKNQDAAGSFQEISFSFTDADRPMTGSMRLYDGKDLVLFSETSVQASAQPPSPFPNFTTLPQNLFQLSYRDFAFSSPRFDLEKDAGPWLLFDAQDHALILSPASHFPIACMAGDGETQLAVGFNEHLCNIPAGFTQQSVLVPTQGINHAFDVWGRALTDWEGKKRIPNDADTVLKYLGYWTDNGAAYWYNYDLQKGYQATLQEVMDAYREKGIPFGYVQLDSWWYQKTLNGPDGHLEKPKNSKLPEGEWNRYGGTINYTADPFIFPQGMESFHENVDLPFVTHNRWIDPTSPYHQRYKISGIAAVDPAFWDEIVTYLHDNGVMCYEQDWLSEIFKNSPELSSTVDQGEAFLDSMAGGCKKQGLSMQYCMATPLCFLQGSKYDNLTTIRCGGDHFIPHRFHDFLFTSKLASALGIWPFADVFQSPMTSCALLSTLSAGPVGSGDALGAENKENLLKIVRADGVIVKPDVPLVPMDRAYLADAQKQDVPILATTYTDHDGLRTIYLIAYKNKKTAADTVSVSADELGMQSPFYFFNYFAGTGVKMDQGASCSVALGGQDLGYFVAAPIGGSGIAFLGDADRFVGTGKKRIAALQDDGQKLTADVIFAEKEQQITLRGYAPQQPTVTVETGSAGPVAYDATTGLFSVTVQPNLQAPAQTVAGDAVRQVTVAFQEK